MATRNYLQDKGYDAAGALTKFRAVKLTAEETVNVVTAVTDVIAGIVQFDVSAAEILKGKGAVVAIEGDSEMEASEAIAAGQLVEITANGRAAVGGGQGARVIGHCVEPAGAAGERIRVHLNLPGTILA